MSTKAENVRRFLGLLLASAVPVGCNAVLGIDEPLLVPDDVVSGGSAGSAGSASGTTGDGGEPPQSGTGGGAQGGSAGKGGSAGDASGGSAGSAGGAGNGGNGGSSGGGGNAVCGNGELENGEQCDDGDTSPFDGCSDKCWRESRVAASYYNSCALLRSGVAKCWGSGFSGILEQDGQEHRGDGPDEMGFNMPKIEFGANFVVGEVASSSGFACARSTVGTVKCWGGNESGQLGQGDEAIRGDVFGEVSNMPPIDLGDGFVAEMISTGNAHACAISTGGVLKCWGGNYAGQLGLGDTNDFGDAPNEMGDLLPAVDLGDDFVPKRVCAGHNQTCAVSTAGKVKCWGENMAGQLGLGDDEPRGVAMGQMGDNLEPVDLGSDFVAMDVACGGLHSCAISVDGKMKCWGSNSYGELGQEDNLQRGLNPEEMGDALEPIDLGTDFRAISASIAWYVTCVVSAQGTAKCFGDNVMGQLGQGDKIYRGDASGEMGDNLVPISLGSGFHAVQMDTWQFHVCALSEAGAVKCWGSNSSGQLGQGDVNPRGGQPNEMGNLLLPVALE